MKDIAAGAQVLHKMNNESKREVENEGEILHNTQCGECIGGQDWSAVGAVDGGSSCCNVTVNLKQLVLEVKTVLAEEGVEAIVAMKIWLREAVVGVWWLSEKLWR